MTDSTIAQHRLTPEDLLQLSELRAQAPAQAATVSPPLTIGERVADRLAATVGSWPFIIVQTALLAIWIAVNVVGWIRAWDPYPFILLNLALSFQAAYTAPIILMSQNRQAIIDRHRAEDDYKINAKAELEIELLHQKIDLLREQEVYELVQMVASLERRLAAGQETHEFIRDGRPSAGSERRAVPDRRRAGRAPASAPPMSNDRPTE